MILILIVSHFFHHLLIYILQLFRVIYDAYSDSKYRFAVKKSSKV